MEVSMKFLTLFSVLFSFSLFAQELKCDIRLNYVGVYYNYCPVGTVSEAVDVRLSGSPQYPFVNVLLRCVKPEVVCKKVND
jgi:hypothetical protein